MFERSQREVGYKKIDGVLGKFKDMVDDLVEGTCALREHAENNEWTIEELKAENKAIDAKIEEASKFESFLRAQL